MIHNSEGQERDVSIRLTFPRPGVPCVHVQGGLAHATAPGLRECVVELLAAAPWGIVLDLRALTDLSPHGVAALVEIACLAGEADIGLYLVAADRPVVQALAAAGVRELFELHPSVDDALRAMGGSQ